MSDHTPTLRSLAEELFAPGQLHSLQRLCSTRPVDYPGIIDFDVSLGGPSIMGVACSGRGRYAVEDRDIFRPLQYCSIHFHPSYERHDLEWQTRDVVEMSSLHFESLVKRIGRLGPIPLGQALGKPIVRAKLGHIVWDQLTRYARVYNDAKHKFSHDKDTHLFSVEEALLAYFISRCLGGKLYPLAGIVTDMNVFSAHCDETNFDPSADPNANPTEHA